MKKYGFAFALAGMISTAGYAGSIDYEEPEKSGVFIIGAEALYYQPKDSNFVYARQDSIDANNFTEGRSYGLNSDYQWGWHVDVAYAFAENGLDLSLGYTNLCTDVSTSKGSISGNNFQTNALGRSTGFLINNTGAGVVEAKTEYDYYDVDLLLGKEFLVQNFMHFHPFAGIRYVNIDAKDRAVYGLNGQNVGVGEMKNDFNGVGPRLGVDAAVEFGQSGMSFIAAVASSVTIGDYDWTYFVNNPGNVNVGQNNNAGGPAGERYKNNGDSKLVPEGDYRLGLNYRFQASQDTSVSMELGWNATYYIGAMNKGANYLTTTVDGTITVWGFQGPYLRVQANIA